MTVNVPLHRRIPTGKRSTRPSPSDGRCECCGTRSGRSHLKWHHCHDCGLFIAWLCNDCNLSLTEHAIRWRDELWRVHDHGCHPQPALFSHRHEPIDTPGGLSRRLYLSNGGGDDRYLSVSNTPGFVTVEQLAAICGVNANTARDAASGRNGQTAIGTKIAGCWLISYDNVLAYLEKRWNL